MERIRKLENENWLVEMTQDEYDEAYRKLHSLEPEEEMRVVGVEPKYWLNGNTLSLTLDDNNWFPPSMRFKPGDKIIIIKKG